MNKNNAVPAKWDATKIAPQTGKKVIITGANSGIGYVTALELARHGADVVLACRNETKGREAVRKIEEELKMSPQAGKVEFRELDVSSLTSVKTFADDFKKSHDHIDLLINNAGIMAVPHALTVDGYESQFATNHLGHFALTARLIDLLKKSKQARVVNLSSIAHKEAKVDLNEIMTPKEKYSEKVVYRNTKVFILLFSLELNRRLRAANVSNVIATTAHPGVTATNLLTTMLSNSSCAYRQFINLMFKTPFIQTVENGTLPSLYAAVGENVEADDFIGPDGLFSITGHPTKEEPVNVARSVEHATKLWAESEKLAKLTFTI